MLRSSLILALALSPLTPAIAADSPAPITPITDTAAGTPTLAVQARARVTRKPEFVDITVGVTKRDANARPANENASKAMEQVIAAVKALGLAGHELQTGSVSLDQKYDHRTDTFLGYDASISLRIRTTDLASVAKVMDAAISAGATRIESVEFQIKEALQAREEALRLAANAAKRKAATLADAMDCTVGAIMTLAEGSGPMYGFSNRYSNLAQANQSRDFGSGDGATSVVPGTIEIWAEVNVTYAIKPKS